MSFDQSKGSNTNKVNANVLYDYVPDDLDEIALSKGDIAVDVKHDDGGWCIGTVNGKRGFFPGSYIAVIKPVEIKAKAIFDYSAKEDNELTLVVGHAIRNIKMDDSGWWLGEANGHRGMFPAAYVEVVNTLDDTEKKNRQSNTNLPPPPPYNSISANFCSECGNTCCVGNFCSSCGTPLGGSSVPPSPTPSKIILQPPEAISLLKDTNESHNTESMAARIGDRLIYDFEKCGLQLFSSGEGLDPQVRHQIPPELVAKGIHAQQWYNWMTELNNIQSISPSENGPRLLFCLPGLCVQYMMCAMCCPISMNHCLSCLPCCYGDWYAELQEWMEKVNKTLNMHDMHAKLLTYKPYTSAPNSRLHARRTTPRQRKGYNYEMSFLAIALTPDESKLLKEEFWGHGVDHNFTSGIGRCV